MITLLLDAGVEAPQLCEVTGEEHHYLTRVRRSTIGAVIELHDANEHRFQGTVLAIGPKRAQISVEIALPDPVAPYPVTVAMAVPKHALMEQVVRQLSELNIADVALLLTERSVMDPGPARIDRWRKIAWESRRQCRRGAPLNIHPAVPLTTALATLRRASTLLLLHPEQSSAQPLWELPQSHPPLALLVGPEGGFTPAEIEFATAAGFQAVRLTPTILRIETATIVAASLAVAHLGALGGGPPSRG